MTRIDRKHDVRSTWGARGSLHLRSVAPGPMCAEGCPLAFARVLPCGSLRLGSAHGARGTPRHPNEKGRNHRFPIRAAAVFWRVSSEAPYFPFPHLPMETDFTVLFSTQHGRVFGRIVEPRQFGHLPKEDRDQEHRVQIAIFEPEKGFPSSDIRDVSHDILDWCINNDHPLPVDLLPS